MPEEEKVENQVEEQVEEQELAEQPEEQKEEKPKKMFLGIAMTPVVYEICSWAFTIAVAVVAALLIRTLIFEPVKVDGESMCGTLQDGDIMVVTKYDYIFGEPQFGDVVICNYPNRGSTKFVKRLMGLPGDTISIVDGVFYRNGEAVDESGWALHNKASRSTSMKEITLGEGEYFVMGDNRDNSNDSRSVGPLTRKQILGHVRCVVYPFTKGKAVNKCTYGLTYQGIRGIE